MGILERWVLNASLHYSIPPVLQSATVCRVARLLPAPPYRDIPIDGLTLENKIPLNCVVIFKVNVLSQCSVIHFEFRRLGHVCR